MFRRFDFIQDNYIADRTAAGSPTYTIYHGFYTVPSQKLTGAIDTSKELFKIVKEVQDASGNTVSFKYASQCYDQIWDNRASLNYY